MRQLRITLLGGFEASRPPGSPVRLSTKKALGLLAYLAYRPGTAFDREHLAALLWGDREDDRARNCLRQALFILRHALGNGSSRVLRVDRDTVGLDGAAVEVDVRSFERLTALRAAGAVREAVELYRGDLLDGFGLNEIPFEEWLRQERQRLRDVAADALARLLRWQREAGETDEAVVTGRRLLALEPWNESVHRALMRLLTTAGHPELALRQYARCAEVLRREFGVDVEPETQRLCESIRQLRMRADPPEDRTVAEDRARSRRPVAPVGVAEPTPAAEAIRNGASRVLVTAFGAPSPHPHPKVLGRRDVQTIHIQAAAHVARLNQTMVRNMRAVMRLQALRSRLGGRQDVSPASAP
jgi:DNA-binding SARP family transcriptional activator